MAHCHHADDAEPTQALRCGLFFFALSPRAQGTRVGSGFGVAVRQTKGPAYHEGRDYILHFP